MEFGVSFQSHIGRTFKHAMLAEAVGLDQAWFIDSQLIASDVYACMTLAAEHTEKIGLGTAITVADTRVPPVIAHSIATINQLAPTRVTLGIGAGHTAWRSMGMPPVTIRSFRHNIEVCKGLLAGESPDFTARGKTQAISFQDTENGYINIHDPIPIYVAASHPRAQSVAGELGDGVITISLLDPKVLKANLKNVTRGFTKANRQPSDPFGVVTVGISCVLRAGEAINSDRVLSRVGPRIAVALHYAYEQLKQGREVPSFMQNFLTKEYCLYMDERWEDIHKTHSRHLHPGEEKFISPDAIKSMSLTGTRKEILGRLDALARAGLTQFAISPPWDHIEESIIEFATEIAGRR